jgi:hypothetical protein
MTTAAAKQAEVTFSLKHDGARVFDLSVYRQSRDDQRSLWLALDHLDAAGWCACWTTPGRKHRPASRYAPSGTDGPA